MARLVLWYSPGACSLATHIVLRETGLQFDLVRASVDDPKDLAKIPDTFAKINPKKRVPVLAIDDEIITEAAAILLAISNLAPELKLYGSTTLENARVAEWLNWISGTLHAQAYGALIRPQRFSADPETHDSIRKQAKATVEQCFRDIEAQLTGQFAVGNSFTVVDAYLVPFWRWGQLAGIAMAEVYPKYTALVTRVQERESGLAALQAEGLLRKEHNGGETRSRV